MIRKALTIVAFTGALSAAVSPALAQQGSPAASNGPRPAQCVGAAHHKTAQQLRVQVLQSQRAAVAARLGVAQIGNHPKAVAHLNARITKIDARLLTVQANIAKFATRCP